jgi:hypothetical protein
MPLTANASPTKRFFVANLTRDLSLEDAILDLIDNSIDGLIRTRQLDVSPRMLRLSRPSAKDPDPPLAIEIALSPDGFSIRDKCGGIGLARAENYAFRIGNADPAHSGSLGFYGIGMKRALFKLGRAFEIESVTVQDGFRMHVDLAQWEADDENWTFPMEPTAPATSPEEAGTMIHIQHLNAEILARLKDVTLQQRLATAIGTTYALFLDRYLSITLNGIKVAARPLQLGTTAELTPALKKYTDDGVEVELLAGLAARVEGEWSADNAGWYVLCNGRVIVAGDRTELTGWGINGPTFVSKYRGFIGVAFFFSDEASKLPWTTTKRGLNMESAVYQAARVEMSAIARPVLTFLNNMYPGEAKEALVERRMTGELVQTDVAALIDRESAPFHLPPRRRRKKSTVSVQFEAESPDVDRIRKRLGKSSSWAAGSVGRYTFEYFLEMECA